MAIPREVQPKPKSAKAYKPKTVRPPTIIVPANDTLQPQAALTLTLNGQAIRDKGEMLSLTDMWKAAGEDPSKRPYEWSRYEGAEFIRHMEAVLNTGSALIDAKRGGSGPNRGQTFAHWQIALAYAKYLSPAFHAACNVVIRERMEGRAVRTEFDGMVTDLNPRVAAQIGGILKGVVHRQLHDLLPALVQAEIVSHQYVGVRGLTAGEVLDMAGFTDRKGLKELAGFVSGKLRPYHAARNVMAPQATLGRSKAYVFDRALARQWLDDGGRREIEMKIAEKRGQTVMKLVQK
nr:KilA-N domain-containing protein [Brevundimonas diminuta]